MKFYRNYKDIEKRYNELPKKELKKLYKGEGFLCTDVVAGRKCRDGGQYGFYTEYTPTKLVGVYEVESSCTCTFDRCGTGFEGYVILHQNEYRKLIEASDRIESEGSLY